MFKLFNLADYVRRHNLRISVKLPVQIALPGRKNRGYFHAGTTSNLSMGGFAAKFIEAPRNSFKSQYKAKDTLEMRFPMRNIEKPVVASGNVEWHKVEKKSGKTIHLMGIVFKKMDFHDKLDLLSVGLVKARTLQTIQILFTTVVFLFILAFVIGTLMWSDKETRKKLEQSEVNRSLLAGQVATLENARDTLRKDLESLKGRITQNKSIENGQNDSIRKMNADIFERQEKIKMMQFVIDDLSDDFNLDSPSVEKITFDDKYKKGKLALKNRNYPQAQSLFEACIRQYPDSVLGYRQLYRTLVESGQTEKADEMFAKSIDVFKKDILKKK